MMEETWAHAPGPLLSGLGQHLNVRDVLRARLTCKHWHAALSLAPLPACAVMPFPGHAQHCAATTSSHPLSTARLLVLHCDEIRYGSLCGHNTQHCECSYGGAAGAAESLSVNQNIQAQVEQLCKACCTSCSQVRLQFWTAASRLSAPPEDPRAAAWTSKVLKSLVLFGPHIRLLHIDLGKHNGPDTLSLEQIRRLPCLSDFHLSCSSITAEHAQVIFQLTGLQVLSLRSAARQRGESWWASPALLGPAKELPKLTSLVLDAPGLLSPQSPLPSLLASWPRLHKLELLGEPSPLADAGPQSASLPLYESKLAPLMEMPALQALSLSIRVLTPADWAILSTLCERQLTLCTLNGWKLESGPRGLTALETPDLSSLTRLGASDDSESALKDQIGLGLSMCKVAKACLRHPAQLPLLLNIGTGAGLHARQVRNSTGPQVCPVEVLHLAFDDGHEDACEDGSPDSPTRQRQEADRTAWYCRSAWSAILGCFALTELNIARAHKLPLTDEVCAELRHRTPVLQVFQYNGFMEVTDGGWASLSSMSKLHTLALGSIKPTESVNAAFVEFSVHLHQLPQQLQCLSLLNAAIHGASSAAGFPPDLRQLSLKFCRLVDSHGPASQGASNLSGLTGMISKLTGLLHLHMSLDETGSPECWGQLASMHSLEDLTLVLSSGARSLTNNYSPLQVLHQIARIPNLQHLKFYAPSVDAGAQQADLRFTREDLDSITSKLKYLRSLELGPLHSDCSQDSRPVGMLHPTQEVAPALATRLPHCRFKLLVNDLLEAISSISQLDQQLNEIQETEDAGSETLDDPELNAELDALQLEEV